MVLMLILSTVVVLFLGIYCSMEGDTNACYDANLRGFYCCAHFEEINGTCVECQVGFKSRQSEQCIPCSIGFYGYRCLFACQCSYWQRCDSTEGCVDHHGASTIQFTTDNSTGSISTYIKPAFSNITSEVDANKSLGLTSFSSSRQIDVTTSSSYYLNESASTNQPLNGADSETEKSGISNRNLMIYSITVTGIILILIVCYIYHRFKKVGINIGLIRDEPRDILENETNSIFHVNEGIYHTIDESQMIEFFENTNSYINDVDTSGSSEVLSSSDVFTMNDQRHGYTSLIVTTEVHLYETCKSASETSAEPPNIIKTTDMDLLTFVPSDCHCLEEKLSKSANIIRSDTDSSLSGDDESDSGYIKPCRQIGTETDIKYVYDISVTNSNLKTVCKEKK